MPQTFTLQELEAQTGVKARTIRDWIDKGLLPKARGRGPTASYATEHLELILAVRRLREEVGLPLKQIETILPRLGSEMVGRIGRGEEPVETVFLDTESPPSEALASPAAPRESAREYLQDLRQRPHRALARASGRQQQSPVRALMTALKQVCSPRPANARARGEWWAEVPITKDLHLRARNLPPEELRHLERAADLLAALLAQPTPDPSLFDTQPDADSAGGSKP